MHVARSHAIRQALPVSLILGKRAFGVKTFNFNPAAP
jgi:hypothetical protein